MKSVGGRNAKGRYSRKKSDQIVAQERMLNCTSFGQHRHADGMKGQCDVLLVKENTIEYIHLFFYQIDG